MTDSSTQEQQDTKHPVKIALSLQLPKKPLSTAPKGNEKEKNDLEENESREYISEIKDGKIIPAQPKQPKGPLIIPIHSGWYEPKEKPIPKGEAKQKTENDKYGLIEPASTPSGERKDEKPLPEKRDLSRIPPLLRNIPQALQEITDDQERFRYDVACRPDSTDLSGYERVPVEEFGKALLLGMGWKPGDPIGLNATKPVPVIEPKVRHHRLGLGAEEGPLLLDPKKNKAKLRALGLGSAPSKANQARGLIPGALVGIIGGSFDGAYGIISLVGAEKSLVKIDAIAEELLVTNDDLFPVDIQKLSKGHPALELIKRLHSKAENSDNKKSKMKQHDKHKSDSNSSDSSRSRKSKHKHHQKSDSEDASDSETPKHIDKKRKL
jgi:G patch domain/KOW motif-containing protein